MLARAAAGRVAARCQTRGHRNVATRARDERGRSARYLAKGPGGDACVRRPQHARCAPPWRKRSGKGSPRSITTHELGALPVAMRPQDRRLSPVSRRQARVAIASVPKMELVCDEAANQRECARTVDRASIRARCGGLRADSCAPASAERTPPIRVEGRGRFVTAPRIRCATCGAVR
jgi:hypothetical protein